jgi:pectate lyase
VTYFSARTVLSSRGSKLVAVTSLVAWAAACSETAPDPSGESGGGTGAGTAGSSSGAPAGGAAPLGGTAGTPAGGASGVGPSGGVAGAPAGGTATGGTASGGAPAGGVGGAGASAGGSAGTAGASGGTTTTGGVGPSGGTGGLGGTGGAGAGGRGGTAGATCTGGTGATGGGAGKGVVGTPIGFATLNGGTTGGASGQTVTATTYAELKMYAESSTAYVILVQGTISNGADGGQINVKSNKSLVGVGSTAFLNGVGLNISSANNIIVQNLRISLTGVTTRTDKAGVYSSTGDSGRPQILVNGGDAIGIQGTSKNIWIDHCEIFGENPDTQTNIDLYDGLIDIKNQTGFITISWNYLHDQHKGGLVGASDTDTFADRKITLHHNHYNKVKLRIPMYRGSVGHFFNNYVVGATDASEIRAGTCVRIEKNYYEPLHYSIYTTSDSAGSTQRIDNVEVMRTTRAYPTDCTADIPYSYSTVLTTTTNDVKTVVPQSAGVGKL